MSKIGNGNKNEERKKKVSPKLVFNKKKEKKCYLYVTKDNASQIACLVFEKKRKKGL